MGNSIWIGAYNRERNAYEIGTVEEICKINMEAYNENQGGLMPICAAATPEFVEAQLEKIREDRKQKYSIFESSVVETIVEDLKKPATAYIEPGGTSANGDDYVNDVLVIAPSEENAEIHIDASVDHYYRVFSEYAAENDLQDAFEKTVHGILKDISDMIIDAGLH